MQAIIEMVVEQREAVEAVKHGTIEIHCHPNQWVLPGDLMEHVANNGHAQEEGEVGHTQGAVS